VLFKITCKPKKKEDKKLTSEVAGAEAQVKWEIP